MFLIKSIKKNIKTAFLCQCAVGEAANLAGQTKSFAKTFA